MKQGLDYFPLDTDFVHNRIVRRILKREGDRSLGVLITAFSYIYGGTGYYVVADEAFYDDLAVTLFESTADDVRRIIALALDYGFFDRRMYEQHGILTSAHIQEQYLFCTKRRKKSLLNPLYALVEAETDEDNQSADNEREAKEETGESVTLTPENVTLIPQRKAKHSTAKHSKAEHSKENPLPQVSPEKGGNGCAGREPAQEEDMEEDVFLDKKERVLFGQEQPTLSTQRQVDVVNQGQVAFPAQRQTAFPNQEQAAFPIQGQVALPDKEKPVFSDKERRQPLHCAIPEGCTLRDVEDLRPPLDGLQRNLDGLLFNLRELRIPAAEQYAIVLKSNYGLIGHPLWKGFGVLLESRGKIRLPGRYLLSLCE